MECYWPGVNEQTVAEASRRVQAASLELGRGHELRFLGSLLIPADETVFSLFQGTEADVRAIAQEADIPLERVVEWCWLDDGGDDPELEGGASPPPTSGEEKASDEATRIDENDRSRREGSS